MMGPADAASVDAHLVPLSEVLPDGIAGIDAGMTLTKLVRRDGSAVTVDVRETARVADGDWPGVAGSGARAGITGARSGAIRRGDAAVIVQEIEAAARGVNALLAATSRLGDGAYLMALMGTGTAFAAVRGDDVRHLGGAALGGGSFSAIARRVSGLTYAAAIEAAARGDRRRVDMMLTDVYPDGIGRLGGNAQLTAAHLAKDAGDASLDDFLAGLLNLHAESIGQIASQRATAAGLRRIVLAGGFVHGNDGLVRALTSMCALFGVSAEVSPAPGFAGAAGAALLAAG
jgi:pantothenate kinase